ncbi:MAG: cation:dicarboxylase symporter family transporter, partial [Oscillospiraceae bacterium]|nr:cation:dicarboxylase symporter family transporter [Oscillospiraceae bacterium]
MKILKSLPAKLIIGIAIGVVLGLVVPESVMTVIVPIKNILGQVIQFVVPLIVIGFIAPSITKLGSNATRMLGVALVLAYVSSVLAAFLSMGTGYAIIPNLPFASQAEALRELPADVFGLAIPQIMGVMSALALAVLLGLAAVWTKAKVFTAFLDEFQKMVLDIVSKVVIPILP